MNNRYWAICLLLVVSLPAWGQSWDEQLKECEKIRQEAIQAGKTVKQTNFKRLGREKEYLRDNRKNA